MSVISTTEEPKKIDWNHKLIWILVLVPFFITLGIFAVTNYIVDPFGLYGTGIYPPVTFSSYEHKLRLFREYEPKPRALVIGSSRVESINPEFVEELTGRTCFNWANPLAKTELFYAELRIALDDYNAPVDLVIVGVEPDVFHPQASAPPQAVSMLAYMRYVSDKAATTVFLDRIARLFSFEQTNSSFMVLSGTSDYNPMEESRWNANGYMVVSDYRVLTKEMIVQGIENEVRDFPEEHWGSASHSNMSPMRKEFWEEFLRICHERSIRVYAYMTPLHPELLETVNNMERFDAAALYAEANEYLSRTVAEVGGVFRDYTDVTSFGGDPEGFYDVVHLQPENGDILLRDLFGDDFESVEDDDASL